MEKKELTKKAEDKLEARVRDITDVSHLKSDALYALKSALSRKDKLGFADKVAVDAAKTVLNLASATDTKDYEKMLKDLRSVITASRKKNRLVQTSDLAPVSPSDEKKDKTGSDVPKVS